VSQPDGMETVPADQEMPKGEMQEPEEQGERDEMPGGAMEAGT
jgi:hypothetical protein